ncbi:MAG: cytochrome c nitrite reductase small subunit [Bacteroidales bacterium]|nr:cytochrome c nitrite reductase small subunit [Bacteroidales bacterium]
MKIQLKGINKLAPPGNWKLPVIILLGIFTGLFLFVFHISKATSYLSDKPETCVNCHIMTPQYATWFHSSHREHAHCNDCHVPHNNVLNKYYFKAKDGLRHATIFTLRREPQVIFIKEAGEKAVHENCIRCHSNLITDSKLLMKTTDFHHYRTERKCTECHREVPHGRVNSLSSTPNARVPLPPSPVPKWLNELTK